MNRVYLVMVAVQTRGSKVYCPNCAFSTSDKAIKYISDLKEINLNCGLNEPDLDIVVLDIDSQFVDREAL